MEKKTKIDRLGSSLTGLRPVKTCQELQQNADQVGGGYLSIIARKLSNFREETQGGRVYGLEYPSRSRQSRTSWETARRMKPRSCGKNSMKRP